MFRHLITLAAVALVAVPATNAAAADSDCLGKACDTAPDVVEIQIEYDADVDADLFTLFRASSDICDTADELIADGLSEHDVIDSAVDVFTEQELVTTVEGVFYLRGLLRGCLAA